MPIKIGTQNLRPIFLGAIEIIKVYLGDILKYIKEIFVPPNLLLGLKYHYPLTDNEINVIPERLANDDGTDIGIVKNQIVSSLCNEVAYYFDGTKDGEIPFTNIEIPYSIAFTFIITEYLSSINTVISYNASNSVYFSQFSVRVSDTGNLTIFYKHKYNGVASLVLAVPVIIPLDTPIRMILTIRNTPTTGYYGKIYVNGVAKSTDRAITESLPVGSLFLGVYKAGISSLFRMKGYMSDILIWNRALTDTDVLIDYDNQCWANEVLPNPPPELAVGMKGHYPMDFNNAGIIVDIMNNDDGWDNGLTKNQTGYIEKAYYHDGTEGIYGTIPPVGFTGSIAMWFKFEGITPGSLLGYYGAFNEDINSPFVIFRIDGKFTFGWHKGHLQSTITSSKIVTNINDWHRLVVTFTVVANTSFVLDLYADSIHFQQVGGAGVGNIMGDFWIFASKHRTGTWDSPYKGYIDHITTWDRVLTLDEVQADFDNPNWENQTPPPDLMLGLKRHYTLDDITDGITHESISEEHGTDSGLDKGVILDGICGYGYYFDGTLGNECIIPAVGRTASIAFTFMIDNTTTDEMHLIGYYIGLYDPGQGPKIYVSSYQSDLFTLSGVWHDGASTQTIALSTVDALTHSTLYRLIFIWEYTSLTTIDFTTYLNGTLIKTTSSNTTANEPMYPMWLGTYRKYNGTYEKVFEGYMDDIIIWDRVLTADEAAIDYTNQCWADNVNPDLL